MDFKKQQTFETNLVDEYLYVKVSWELSLEKKGDKTENKEENEAIEIGKSIAGESDAKTLSSWAARILRTADPVEKCSLTLVVAEMWRNGELEIGFTEPPDIPERQETLNVLEPNKIKRGKGGTLVNEYFSFYSHRYENFIYLN